MEVFAGRIYKVGIIWYVDVPKEISQRIGAKEAHVAVRGTVEECHWRRRWCLVGRDVID